MILHEIKQGSDQWHDVRRGIPTASQFHRILTPAKGDLASGRWSYAFELAIERLLNESKDPIDGLRWVERGKVLEQDAVRHYEFLHGRTVEVGFISADDKRWGCSPDRILVDEVGALELKCPSAPQHLAYFIDGLESKYKCQLQGCLLVTGFPFIDFMSFHPQLPQVYIRTGRDESFIEKLRVALDQFCDEVDQVCEKVKDAGYVPDPSMLTRRNDDGWSKMLQADAGLWAIG